MAFKRKSSRYTAQGGIQTFAPNARSMDNYKSLSTGIRRHNYSLGAPNIGSATTLVPNGYFGIIIARFLRSFAGVDGEPTATASNNYASSAVMNGSKIMNMDTQITLKNTSATQAATLDVYQIELSFYDALIWDTVFPTKCPVSFGLVANNEGEISFKTHTTALVNDQDILNYKFLQRYMKRVGTVTIGNADNDNTVLIKVNNIPPKCRRSQTGMFYALVFANTSVKNAGATLNIDPEITWNFDEIPSDNRLPYID